MEQNTLNIIYIIFSLIMSGGLVYFSWRQTQINKRMQELSEYVAISIAPGQNFQLQIINVGRINLYLHKWEIGHLSETFVKPWLLPVEGKSIITINLLPPPIGQHLAKFYITDEKGRKYLSEGEVAIEPISVQLPLTTTPPQEQIREQLPTSEIQQINIQLRMRAWSYKTVKYNWTI
jgi:hypothetical protein